MCRILLYTLISLGALTCGAFAIDEGTIELGTDASIALENANGDHYFSLNAPTSLRVGPYISESTSLEFRFATSVLSTGGHTYSTLSFMFGPSVLLNQQNTSTLAFFELLGTLDAVSGGRSASQFGLGAGFGVKGHGRPFNPRGEIMFVKRFESDVAGSTTIQVNVGISFFSR